MAGCSVRASIRSLFVHKLFQNTYDDGAMIHVKKAVFNQPNGHPILLRETAANKFSHHQFLALVASVAQRVVVCSKTLDVVLDDVVAKDGDDDGLVCHVVPTKSGASNNLERRILAYFRVPQHHFSF